MVYSLEGSHYVNPTHREYGVMLYLLEERVSTSIVKDSSAWRFGYSPPFIYFNL